MTSSIRDSVRHGADRFQQEQLGQPIWDRIYRSLWGPDTDIERALGTYEDIKLGIDSVVLTFTDGGSSIFRIQEKTLSYYYGTIRGFDTLTVEDMQDPDKNVTGNWHNMDVDLIACAYLNEKEDDFTHGCIADWFLLKNSSLNWKTQYNKDGQARASFKYVNIKDIPDDLLLWRRSK